jgi:hypothetical protein
MRKYKTKNKKITTNNLTNMHKQTAIFVKYVDVPTDCIGSRNTSSRGTGLKVTKNRKSRNDLDGMRKLIESKMEGHAMLPSKALIKKQHQ